MSRTTALPLLASALLLTACGSQEPPGGSTSTTPTTPSSTQGDGKFSTGKPVPSSPTTVGRYTSLTTEQVTSALLQKTQVPSGPWADAPADTASRPDPAVAMLDRVHMSSPACRKAVEDVKAVLADQGSAGDARAFTSTGIVPQAVRVSVRVASEGSPLMDAEKRVSTLGTTCSTTKIGVPDEVVLVRPVKAAAKDAAAVELVSKAAAGPVALAVASRGANTVIVSSDGATTAGRLATDTLTEQVARVEKAAG